MSSRLGDTIEPSGNWRLTSFGAKGLVPVDHYFTHGWAVDRHHGADRFRHIVVSRDPSIGQPESRHQALEIWKLTPLPGPAPTSTPLKKVAMSLEDRNVTAVVEQEYFNGHARADDRLQFLQVHHDRAIAGQADDRRAFRRHASADGGGQVIAHAGASGIGPQPLTGFQISRLEAHDAGAAIGVTTIWFWGRF